MVVICSICKGSLACPPKSLTGNGNEIENCEAQQDMETDTTTPAAHDTKLLGEGKYEPHAIAPMCGHLFHSSCLTNWLTKHGEHKCPVCSCMIPPDQMTKVYLSTGPDTGKSESSLDPSSNSTVAPNQDPTSCSITLKIPSLPTPTTITSNVTSEEPTMPLQISETTINGVRTVVYRFSLGGEAANDTANNQLIQIQSQGHGSQRERRRESRGRSGNRHQGSRQENPDRSRSPHPCLNCSNLEKIQVLMMKEMADLKRVVAEQKTMIASLEQALKLSSSGASNSSGLVDVNANLM